MDREDFFELFEAELEDVFDIALDEELVDDWGEDPAFGFVDDRVGAEGGSAIVDWGEGVGVVPEGVGAFVLVVDEGVRRVPVLDGGFPSDGDVVDFESVVDDCPGLEVDGFGGEHFESEEGWGEFFEVEGVGEEGEDFIDRAREYLGGGDFPDFAVLGVGRWSDVDGILGHWFDPVVG